MNQHTMVDAIVREALEIEPSAEERAAVWQSIAEGLAERERNVRYRRRLGRLVPAGVVALALGVAIVVSPPLRTNERGLPLPAPAEAQAAAVLDAAASGAGSTAAAVGPHERLLTRTSQVVPGHGAVDTRSLAATDGSARIVVRERSSRGLETSSTRYRPGSDVAVETRDGVTTRRAVQFGDWRAVVPGDQIANLPTQRDAMLATLRAGVAGAARRLEAIAAAPARDQPGGVRTYYPVLDQLELSGHDLFVVEAMTELLVWAPLSPDQRVTLFSLLADIRDWYRPGTSAAPVQIRDLGATEDALGRPGTAVRIATEPTPAEAARAGGWLVDLVLDPGAGRVLETRSYEHGPSAQPVRETVTTQRVVAPTGS